MGSEGAQMTRPTSAATERALKLVAKGWTPYAAAKKEGLALSTIYRALKRGREKQEKQHGAR
jgi:transposase